MAWRRIGPRQFRLRWYSSDVPPILTGKFLIPETPRARAAYLILGAVDKGRRGSLGLPVFRLLILTVERVNRLEALRMPEAMRIAVVPDRKRRPAARQAKRLSDLMP